MGVVDWYIPEEKEPEPKFYLVFDPQPDITAFELSRLFIEMSGLISMFGDGYNKMMVATEKDLDIWKNLPSSLRRHFRVTDKLEEEDGTRD